MIAKRVARKSLSSYAKLANYIAAANDPGEKLDALWIRKCGANENIQDLDLAILDIEHVQSLNTRSKADKSYHLIVSFRDEKPSPEALRDIEAELAKALGFEEHQRIIATHQNTDNFHMHIAYNKIHPGNLKIHHPKQDFRKLEKCCRAMEKKYGLKVDLGKEDKVQEQSLSPKARDYEAITWEQSFEGYVKEQKPALMELRKVAKEWQDLHNGFAQFGLEICKRGNGLVIKEKGSDRAMKASALDRSFSKAALEKEFGAYRAPGWIKQLTPKRRYKRQPITKYPKQFVSWHKYLARINHKESLTGKAYRNWREFLAVDSISDPLAMAIIMHHKKMLRSADQLLATKFTKSQQSMQFSKSYNI
ncbi:MAG: TraI/MobA(P) family conjugative relaxase [Sneathiella sp.]